MPLTTTQNISTVIRPKGNDNSLQFVKIQTPELSKKAVEQIRIAEEGNISKEKIKEVEEEWQNNLLNWKSKRRQQLTQTFEQAPNDLYEITDSNGGRKTKTFAEMIEERAKSGNRLGFHLQRYLSTDDDDEGRILDNREAKSFLNDSDESKNRADSDYEAHSSTSSGFNQLDSKSPSSSEVHLEISRATDQLKFTDISRCDSRPNFPNQGKEETHSISLVENSQLNPTNSTPRHDVISSPAINRSKSFLDIDTKANEISAISDQCSENSVSEEDGEEEEEQEEEEQKQLQRIAFEAKLKAFEKLTKPTPQKPEIAPKRITRVPIQSPKVVSPSRAAQPPIETSPMRVIFPPKETTPQRAALPPRESPLQRAALPPRETPPQRITIPLKTVPPTEETPPPKVEPQVAPPPNLEPLPRITSPTKVTFPFICQPKETPPPRVAPQLEETPPMRVAPPPKVVPSPKLVPPPASLKMREFEQQSPKNRCLVNQSAPETPKSVSSQRKLRDDKDRTVLSVSGKKRCSSCKEELGRGAAAFVVESLALVYHTNCFRCSVCHVNLSNGFRGVDVRVHAGALHCQNCYSKDGLNYSRV